MKVIFDKDGNLKSVIHYQTPGIWVDIDKDDIVIETKDDKKDIEKLKLSKDKKSVTVVK